LGYKGITPSVGIKFDLFNNDGEGVNSTGLFTNGVTPSIPAIDLTPSGIDLHSGHTFFVKITYLGTKLTVKITDTDTGNPATQHYTIDIPSVLGSSKTDVGFTGGTGSQTATQDILDWTFSQAGEGGAIYFEGGDLTM